jgi:hypothetical protein
VPALCGVTRHGLVGEHDVELVRAQVQQQLAQAAALQADLHVVARQQRLQQPQLEVARQRRHRAHAQHAHAPARPALERGQQFLAGGVDGIGVLQRHTPGLGEHEAAAAALEQGMAEPFFELPQLHRQRRGRDMQPLGRARQALLVRDGAEVAQVVVIELGHGGSLAFCFMQ